MNAPDLEVSRLEISRLEVSGAGISGGGISGAGVSGAGVSGARGLGPVPGQAAPVVRLPDDAPSWVVLRELGRGTGSVVHLAARGDREYALKRPRPGVTAGGETDRMLRREAALLASVHHPGLTRVHAVAEVEGRTAIVMDAHDGTTLADLLLAPAPEATGDVPTGPLSLSTALRLVVDVCDALDALHRNGLVHRDVKPANILVTRAGRAVLVDLGVAHLEPAPDGHRPEGGVPGRPDGPERRRPTALGAGGDPSDAEIGALLYRSPEQAGVVRSPVDHRSDLWSVGAVLLACLTGRTPVEGTEATAIRRRLSRLRPLDPGVLGPEVPPAVALLLRRLLALDPQDRPPTSAAVADELSRIAADTAPDIALGRRAWTNPTDGPLLERGQQLTALERAWDNARGGAGGVAVVQGVAGSGRTSLVEQVRRRATAAGAATVVLDSTVSSSTPLSALRQAMSRGGLVLDGPAPTDQPDPEAVSGEREEPREARPQALAAELLQHAAVRGPLLVVLDDVEHADASTLAVLQFVAGECADLPLLLVVVDRLRPGLRDRRPDLATPFDTSRSTVVDVPALSDAAARAVVRRRLPGAVVTDSVATALVSRAAGNPGALLALLTALLDDGGLLPDWGHWKLEHAALEAVPVAPRLLAALTRRVEELPAGHRHVLRLAAACGRSVDDDLVLQAAGTALSAATVHAGLAAGVAARLLRPLPQGRHEFLHQQVVDAVLDEVGEVERQALHARLARVLRARTRAGVDGADRDALFACAHQHLRAGTAVAPGDVVDACAAAGVEAARQYAPESAVALLGHAVRIADEADLPLDPRLRRLLAASLARAGRHSQALPHLEHLARRATDPLEQAVVLGEAATLHRHERASLAPRHSAGATARGLDALRHPRPDSGAGWLPFTVAALLLVLRTSADPRLRRASRHRLDSPSEVERSTLEGAHAVLLREAASSDLDLGHPRRAIPTALASWGHALRARRPDLARDARRTVVAAVRQSVMGTPSLLPVRLPTTSGLVGRPLTTPESRQEESDPAVLAAVLLGRGLRRLGRGGTWLDVATVLQEQGRWLDLPTYVAGSQAVAVERFAAGHLTTAQDWHDRAVRRLPEGVRSPAGLDLVRVALLGAKGRPGEAGEVLDAVRRNDLDDPAGSTGPLDVAPMHRWRLLLATTTWLVQQVDLSERFDHVAGESTRSHTRAGVWGTPEVGWTATLVVRGRLAQLQAAQDAGDVARARVRRQELRESLHRLRARRGSTSALQAVLQDVVRAAAALRLGRPRRAERLLRRADRASTRLDAPLVAHHLLLLRAELLEAAGARPDAERLRWLATALAEKHGWVNLVHRGRVDLAPTQPSAGDRGTVWTPAPGRRRRLLSAMRDVGHAAQVLDPHDVVRLALDQACEVLGADRATLAVLDPDGELDLFAGRTRNGTDLPTSVPVDPAAVRAARTGRPVVRGALDNAPRTGAHVSDDVARSVVAVPLLVRGRRTGVLAAASTVAQGAFGRGDVELLQLIAGQVAASLETARAARLEIEVHGAQRERDLAEAVRRVTEEVSGSLDLSTVRSRLLRAALAELGGTRGALVPVSVNAGTSAQAGDAPALVTTDTSATVREVLWSTEWRGEPECVQLLERSGAVHGDGPLPARLAGLLDLAGPADEAVREWLVVPLKDRTGLVAEALVLVGDAQGPAARAHIAEALAAPAAIGLENARLFAQVEHLARTDSLTGVATRGHLLRLGEQRVRRSAPGRDVAVLMVDVDHFKTVNDTYGHAAGDEVLTAVARRLQNETRESDVLGRYGGEEFALVVTSPGPEEGYGPLDAREIAERLRVGVSRTPVEVRGEQLRVTVSVGVALLRDGEQLSDVLARADTALYRAKAAGRDVVVVAP